MISTLSKKLLRKTFLSYRRMLAENDYKKRNESIVGEAAKLLELLGVQSLHTFLAMKRNREPDVSSLIDALWKQGKRVIISTTDFEKRTLIHSYFTSATEVKENRMGIPEPVSAEPADPSEIDVIFVPLVVADKQGNRVGYGGGFYDQLLAETNAVKVGLSLSPPVDLIMQRDEWDVPLNYLITPNKTYQYG